MSEDYLDEIYNTIIHGTLDEFKEILRTESWDLELVDGFSIIESCVRDDFEKFKACLDAGADVDWRDPQGRTLVYFAIDFRSDEALNLLIERGASVNGSCSDQNDQTPLHVACKMGEIAMIDALLQAGADCEAKDRTGKTPRDVALNDPVTALLDAYTARQRVKSIIGAPKIA